MDIYCYSYLYRRVIYYISDTLWIYICATYRNAPHPTTDNTPSVVYDNWVKWNNHLFDGFDWDVEGNDDLSKSSNQFTQSCLDLMGEMSQLAKADGYFVTMAPAESYLDPTTHQYDHSLRHNYPEWEALQPDFHYHGHNTYGYLLQVCICLRCNVQDQTCLVSYYLTVY